MIRKILVILTAIPLMNAISLSADSPKWIEFNEGIEKVKKEQRPMLLMVYATWCGVCKKMERTTLSDRKIIDFLEKNYIPVKMNADEQENIIFYNNQKYMAGEFLSSLGLRGVPSFVFIDKTGKVIGALPGYFAPDVFYNILLYIKDACYLKNISLETFVGNPKKCASPSK